VTAKADDTRHAFEQALVVMMPRLRRFCVALCGQADPGDDLAQAVLERALMKQAQFRQGTRLDLWLFRMARNLRIDLARAAKSRGGPGESLDLVAEQMGEDGRELVELRSELSLAGRAYMALPEGQREVFGLVVIEGLAYREVADLLDLPIGTIMSRVARARMGIEVFVRDSERNAGDDGSS
jgi:RNA polymerase sigma-70 factor, ECF subfamily